MLYYYGSSPPDRNEILEQKALADIVDEAAGHPKATLREFTLEYFRNRYGLAKIANTRMAKFLMSVVKHDQRAVKLDTVNVWKGGKAAGEKGKQIAVHATNDQCVCGNHFLTDSLFCRKCGVPRPGMPAQEQPPLKGSSSHEICGCGNQFRGDSKFCRKCGRARPKVPSTSEQCGCGNIFLTDSKYCRRCGERRPGNNAPKPLRKGDSTFFHCACGNAFAGDSLYCRKCGLVRPHELPNWRFGVFLLAVGLKAQRQTLNMPELGDLLILSLRRAFSKNLKIMSELLGDEGQNCPVSIEVATHMVIGPEAERRDPKTWNAPQLSQVCNPRVIEKLLDDIALHNPHRIHGHGMVSTRRENSYLCFSVLSPHLLTRLLLIFFAQYLVRPACPDGCRH